MMQHIKQMNILDMMKMYGEDSCRAVLSTCMCPLNIDVEDFIHNKAMEFARQRIAITFIVFQETESDSALVGYYTLANKFVSISGTHLSKTLQKKIARFSQYDEVLERFVVSMPLITLFGTAWQNLQSKPAIWHCRSRPVVIGSAACFRCRIPDRRENRIHRVQ